MSILVSNNPSILYKAFDRKYLNKQSRFVFNFLSKYVKDFNDLLKNKIYDMTTKDLMQYLHKLIKTNNLIKIKYGQKSIFQFNSNNYDIYLPSNDIKKKVMYYMKIREYVDYMHHKEKIEHKALLPRITKLEFYKDTEYIIELIIYVYALKTMEALQKELLK